MTFSNQTPAVDPHQWLYVSDLDGTLLNSEYTLSQNAIKRLNCLINRGLKFTIATARDYDSAYPLLRGMNLNIPVALLNGVYLMEFNTGKNVDLRNFIPSEIADEILSLAEKSATDSFVFTFEENPRIFYQKITNSASREFLNSLKNNGGFRNVSQSECKKNESLSGVILIDTATALEPIYQTLLRKYGASLNINLTEDVTIPGLCWLKIFHQYADKGSIIKLLANHLGIPLSRVMVFGDYLNDLPMFKIAGRCVAVANARPEVKEAAHEIIGSNDSDSVIEYLESLELEE